jgi:hypothetical protein
MALSTTLTIWFLEIISSVKKTAVNFSTYSGILGAFVTAPYFRCFNVFFELPDPLLLHREEAKGSVADTRPDVGKTR